MYKDANNKKWYTSWKNKGVSFVELLIAMVLLLIILGPIMRAIISGMEVNRNSRKLMCATDAAQGVMEGISGKSFSGLRESFKNNVSIKNNFQELARVGGQSTYNETTNIIRTYGNTFNGLSVPKSGGEPTNYTQFSLTLDDGTVKTFNNKKIALCENAADTNDSFYLLQTFGQYGLGKMTDPSNQNLVMHCDNSSDDYNKSIVLFFAYYNVPWQGYTFDIVGYVIPATTSTKPAFYPCVARIGVYEVKKDGTHELVNDSQPLMTMSEGLRNR